MDIESLKKNQQQKAQHLSIKYFERQEQDSVVFQDQGVGVTCTESQNIKSWNCSCNQQDNQGLYTVFHTRSFPLCQQNTI